MVVAPPEHGAKEILRWNSQTVSPFAEGRRPDIRNEDPTVVDEDGALHVPRLPSGQLTVKGAKSRSGRPLRLGTPWESEVLKW